MVERSSEKREVKGIYSTTFGMLKFTNLRLVPLCELEVAINRADESVKVRLSESAHLHNLNWLYSKRLLFMVPSPTVSHQAKTPQPRILGIPFSSALAKLNAGNAMSSHNSIYNCLSSTNQRLPMTYRLPTRILSLSYTAKNLRRLGYDIWVEASDHELLTRAAAISFYAMLAFVPLIAIVFAVSVELFAQAEFLPLKVHAFEHSVTNELEHSLRNVIPGSAYEIVEIQILRMKDVHPGTILSIGSVISLWTASSLFMAIMDGMNHIYGVKETRGYWHRRLLAIVMTMVQTVILLALLITIVAGPQIFELLHVSGIAAIFAGTLHLVAAFVATLVALALIFQIGPHSHQRNAWVTPGGIFGALVFLLISFGFRFYVQNFGSYDKVYGSLGGVMILLLWFWLSSAVVLVSAAINKVLEVRADDKG